MRAIVCDPVCAQPFGHNAVALTLFRRALENYFDQVEAVCCKYLPAHLVEKHGFSAYFQYYYHSFIPLRNFDDRASLHTDDRQSSFADDLEVLATADARNLLASRQCTSDDTIVFPSVDFYGLVGLFNALAELPVDRQPKLLLRFIGVMETASKFYRDPMTELAGRIVEARDAGIHMTLSAETPKLAEWLSDLLDIEVSTTPYPDVHQPLAFPKLGTFDIYCPGSARADKGFFSLREIFTDLRRRDPKMNIRFVTQSLNANEAQHHQDYTSQLYAIPGLELLPGAISDEMMVRQFGRSCAVLLPYARDIYALRGSAAMMEAVCWGRPIITLSGTAFAEQVSWYRLGVVVNSPSEMAAEVLRLAQEPREKLERNMLRGRARFLADVERAYQEWLRPAI